jgi:micrococcal nuclease
MKKYIVTAFMCATLFIGTNEAFAHPGAREELGGHFKRANCTYHFHSPTKLTKNKTKAQIVSLIKKYNSNNKCTRGLTEKKVDWSTLRK